MKEKNRIPYIDLLRCVAACFVIAIHCLAPYWNDFALFGSRSWWVCGLLNTLAKTGVPLFFMISGALLLSEPQSIGTGEFYRRRFSRLALPFLFWNLLYFLAEKRYFDVHLFLSELAFRGSKYHLWFLYQIGAIYLFLPFLKKAVQNSTKKEVFLLFLISIFPSTILRFLNLIQSRIYIFPFNNILEGYLGFFLLGYLLHTTDFTPGQRRLIYILGLTGACLGLWGNAYFSSFGTLNLVFDEGYSIVQFLTAGAVFLFIKEHETTMPPWLPAKAAALSRLSFGVYLNHILVLECFWALAGPSLGRLSILGQVLCRFVFTLAASTALAAFSARLPLLRRTL